MPIFEYKCQNCKAVFEELRPANDNAIIICGNCGSDNVVKLFSAFASGPSAGSSSPSTGCGGGGFS